MQLLYSSAPHYYSTNPPDIAAAAYNTARDSYLFMHVKII